MRFEGKAMKDRCPVESELGRLYILYSLLFVVVVIIIIMMAIVNNSEMKRFSLFPAGRLVAPSHSVARRLSPTIPPLLAWPQLPNKKENIPQHEIIIIIILRENSGRLFLIPSPNSGRL